MDDSLKNFNEILDAYNNISELLSSDKNKNLLEEQKKTNSYLLQLKHQFEKANKANAEILRLQIFEHEKKLEQRYFKSLAFFLLQLTNYLKGIDNKLIRYYLLNPQDYYNKIREALITCNDLLEDIPDKLFTSETISSLDQVKQEVDHLERKFQECSLSKIDHLLEDFKIQDQNQKNLPQFVFIPEKFEHKRKTSLLIVLGMVFSVGFILIFLLSSLESFQRMITDKDFFEGIAFLLLSIGFVFLTRFLVRQQKKRNKKHNQYLTKLKEFNSNEQLREEEARQLYNSKIKESKEELLKHPMYDCMREIYNEFPDFFTIKKQLSEYEKKFLDKINLNSH